ncbi:MAG TPA: O-antigen ligase family protein [Gaiellaceae bacterium]|nr:O-antigen ligase family protein [Gaiellaceae bacterium]
MPSTRHVPLVAALVLAGFALFAGGGAGDGSVAWLGAGALAVLLAALALQGLPGGLLRVLPLAALAAWCGVTIAWSTMPDRSWDYANRGLLYLLFALVGLTLAGERERLASGLAALLGAVAVWALAGLVFPGLNGDASRTARLMAPVGLWNQLALLGDFALPLALWLATRRRVAGTLLAYAWLVALVLTLSRGGLAVAAIVAIAWLALSREAVDGIATLVAAAVPAAVASGVALALPGVSSAGQPSHVRWHDGLLFGVVLLAGALVAVLLARAPRPAVTPTLRRAALAVAAVLVAAVVVVAALKAGSAWRQFTSATPVGNGGARVTTVGSNFRWPWWQQAWHAATVHPGGGTGAGTFELTNLLYRQSYLDTTTEPHELPLQFLSETGIPGLLLFLAAVGGLLVAVRRRRGHELALALVLPAWFLHGLVDIDWDFVAVSAPAFLVAGALVGRPAVRRVSPFAVLASAGVAFGVFVCLLLPWLGHRWDGQAQAQVGLNDARAASLARRARSADPLLVGPVLTQALAASSPAATYAYYREATRMQPDNPYTWRALGQFLLQYGCPRLALPALQRYTDLDDHAPPSQGADDKDAALAYVNSGKADPRKCGG